MKTVALNWNAFMDGNIVPKEQRKQIVILAKTAAGVHALLIPSKVFAASAASNTWTEVFGTVLGIADWLCVGIIVYAGITWMFGNRTKAIEFLMGGSIGYIIVRHAMDIKNWLKTL